MSGDQSGRIVPTPLTRAIGAELRRCLAEQGVSQKDLAERMGTNPAWVSLVCSGKKNVTIGRLADVFAALGYDLDVTARVTPVGQRRSQKRARAGGLGAPRTKSQVAG